MRLRKQFKKRRNRWMSRGIRDSRRNNVILYNESEEHRSEDRNKDDVSFGRQLFNTGLHVGIGEEDVVKLFRLGKRGEREQGHC